MPHSLPVELTPGRSRRLLEQRLRTERLDLAELRGLLAAPEPDGVHAALLHLKRRLERLEGEDTPSHLLEALPVALGACAPETHVLLAEVARLLPPEVPMARLAALSEAKGPRPVEAELAWLVTEVLREPARLARHPGGELLLRAVQRLAPAEAADAEALVDALCAHPDPDIQRMGLRHLGDALALGFVPLTHALALAVRALEAPDARVALQAAELLAEPWAARAELAPAVRPLQSLLGRSERLAIAALRALARRGEAAALRLVLEDEQRWRSVRREAMALLAPFASHEELRLALLVSRQDPLYFGPTCAALLQTLYRRGVRCEPEDVPLVRELFLSSPGIEPEVLAEVLSLRQREYVEPLRGLPPTDPDFPRHLTLLRELDGAEALDLLRALLLRPEARPLWPEVIEALGHQGHEAAEEDLLACFEVEPWACLDALRHLGGPRTVAFLRSHPGVSATETGLEGAVMWRAEALALLAALDDAPPSVQSWRAGGAPGPEVFASLQPVFDDAAFEEVARLALHSGHPLRLQAIGQLGREARLRVLVPLGALLLDEDEHVRSAAHGAIASVGLGLRASGRARPRVLLTCSSGDDAGALVLAECLLDQLQRADLSNAQLERVLGQLVGRKHPALARRVRRFLRHGSVQVQKLALECLAGSGDPRAVAWLVPFARSEDIYRLRQVLLGLGAFKVEWAVPLIAAGLDHPNMNIKKTAAESLASTGPGWPAPIAVMLGWLRRHDNPGLRRSLVRALLGVCGRRYVATVLDALREATSPREQELLCETLSDVLSPHALVALLRRGAPMARVLLDAVYGGVLELPTDALDTLAVLLRRHGLAHLLPASSDDPVRARLLRERRLDADLVWMDDLLSSGDAASLEAAEEGFTKLLSGTVTTELTDSRAAVLTRHLEVIRGLLDSPRLALRRLARSLLELLALSGRLSEPERVGALADVRRALAASRLEPREALTVMHRLGAVLSRDEARVASALPDERVALWGAERLGLAGELSGQELLDALVQSRSAPVRRFFVPFALHAVPPLQVLEAVARGPHPDLLETVRQQWGAGVAEEALVAGLLQAAEAAGPVAAGILVRWLGDVGTEAARAALRRLARRHEQGLALTALSALGTPASDEDEALMVELVAHAHVEVRRQAARHLWRIRGLPRLQGLLEHLGAERPLRWVPPGALDRRDLEALRAMLGSVDAGLEGEMWLESLAELLGRLQPKMRETPAYVALLLDVWRLGRGRSAKMAAGALRSLPVSRVLPFLLPMLREGHTAVLDVLASGSAWGPELMALFSRARGLDRTHFLELLERGASAQALEGHGLEEVLLGIVHEDADHREAALRVLGGLAAWGTRETAFRLGGWLGSLANREGDARVLDALLRGLERQGAEVRIALLSQVASPALRGDVVAALAPLVLDDPSLDRALTPALLRDVERRLETLAWEGSEPDPRALELMALRRGPHVIDRLSGMLSHRKPWVRLRAHRLLRELVSRELYLDLTRELLKDPEAGHVVRAIRTLAFGGHRPAVADLAALLHDHRNPVAHAALDGLLVMGDTALPILRGELAHARPDRRATLARVISSLETVSASFRAAP
ncbi:HEAT repeat domain-containing protein [Pyxidicoccus trucidator]|uniref:HEAT repeat domain-containing protein n=1 Tax=Pyxidicoccus trucidator TaxID=2709662 RepID=UPI0013DA81AF|nr:HEAT repeat domain-containing protein [Pyxidicoccus trucidator]